MENKKIICKKCKTEFLFTAEEQVFYKEKGLKNEPSFCKECRSREKVRRKKLYPAVCSKCGCKAWVPFQPKGDRPIYCQSCFSEKFI